MTETLQRIQLIATTGAFAFFFVITLALLSLPVLKRVSKRGFAVFCVGEGDPNGGVGVVE